MKESVHAHTKKSNKNGIFSRSESYLSFVNVITIRTGSDTAKFSLGQKSPEEPVRV